uniref:Viral late gene transcription factor 3 zinc ribbon domain-containing protein n=1 Tax=viral metagenome TaxID=1070528 RepID=A0A6C0B3E9_9ZZZZ
METFKKIRKKKVTMLPIKTTLNQKHKNKLTNFNKNITMLPSLKKEFQLLTKKLKSLQAKKNNTLTGNQLENKLNIRLEITKLKERIDSIENNEEYYNYLLESSALLYEYNSIPFSGSENKTIIDFFSSNKKISITSPSRKKKIMNKFIKLTNNDFIPEINNYNEKGFNLCETCNERRIVKSKKGLLICPKCGCTETILVDTNAPSYKEPPREVTYFAYKKINHANEFLSQFQAKESTDIHEEIYNKILNELKKERYINIKNITADKVREILKKLELTKYYEHSHYITNRLSGKPAPILNNVLEDKLRNMFKQVQGPWLKYCPNKRANFFSYPYIFFKFFQLLEEDEYLPYCRLLKSREKLHEHDEVWKKICSDLNWEFIPTV